MATNGMMSPAMPIPATSPNDQNHDHDEIDGNADHNKALDEPVE